MKTLPFLILLALCCSGSTSNYDPLATSNSTSASGGLFSWMSYFLQNTVPIKQTITDSNDTTYNSSNNFVSFIVKNMKTTPTDLNSTITTSSTSERLRALLSSFTEAFGITQTDREGLLDLNSTSNVTLMNFLSRSVHLAPNITEEMENLEFVVKNISLDTSVSCTAPSLAWWCFRVKFFVVENPPNFKAKFIGETSYQCMSHNIPLKGTWEYYEPRRPYHIHAIIYHDCKYKFESLKYEKKLNESDVAKFFESKTMTDVGTKHKNRTEIFTKYQLEDESEQIKLEAERYDAEFMEKFKSAEKADTLNISNARYDSAGALIRRNYTIDAQVKCGENERWCFMATLEAVPKDGRKMSKEVGRTHRCTEENHVDILETFESLVLRDPHTIHFTLYHSCRNSDKENGKEIRKISTELGTGWRSENYISSNGISYWTKAHRN